MKKIFIALVIIPLLTSAKTEKKAEKVTDSKTEKIKKISLNDIPDHATQWAKNLPKLSTEEITLLANYLYFCWHSNTYESQTLRNLIDIQTKSILMSAHLFDNQAVTRELTEKSSEQIEDLKENLLTQRNYGIKACLACLKEIEESEYKELKEVITRVQQYCDTVVNQFIKQDNPAIKKIVVNGNDSIEKALEKISEGKEALQLICDGKNPYLKDNADSDVIDCYASVNLANTLFAHIGNLLLATSSIKSMGLDILNIKALIHKQLFNKLYQTQVKSKKSALYIKFDENGLIDEDQEEISLTLIEDK